MHRPPDSRGGSGSLVEQSPWIISQQPAELLTETPAGAISPAIRGGRVTNTTAVAGRLTVEDRLIQVQTSDITTGTVIIRLSDVVYVRESNHVIDGTTVDTVSIRHLEPPSNVLTTAVHVWDDREREVFTNYVRRYYRKQKQQLTDIELTDEQLELLVTIYFKINQFDISDVLNRPTAEIRSLFGPLREAGLIGQGGVGSMLTARGFMYVNEELDEETL